MVGDQRSAVGKQRAVVPALDVVVLGALAGVESEVVAGVEDWVEVAAPGLRVAPVIEFGEKRRYRRFGLVLEATMHRHRQVPDEVQLAVAATDERAVAELVAAGEAA